MRSLVPAILSAAAGLLLALPWLDERKFATAWLGLVPVVAVCDRQPPHVAFRCSLTAGIISMATGLDWFPHVAADNLQVSLFSGFTTSGLAIVWDAFRMSAPHMSMSNKWIY